MAIDPQQLQMLQQQPQGGLPIQEMQQEQEPPTPEDLIINLIQETAQNQSLAKDLQANIIKTYVDALSTIISIQLETAKLEQQFHLDELNYQIQLEQRELEQEKIKTAKEKATLDTMAKLAQHQDQMRLQANSQKIE